MTSQLRGRTVLRLAVCSHRTTFEDIERVFEEMRRLGHRFDQEAREAQRNVPPVVDAS